MIGYKNRSEIRTRSKQRCALFVALRSISLATSRLPIMRQFLAQGWRVVAAGGIDDHVEHLTTAGIEFEEVPFYGGGLSPWQDSIALLRLLRLYRRLKPGFIYHSQAKPVILGCAAARLCPEAKVVNLITGLGHAYTAEGLVRSLASTGYRLTLKRAARTVFQNPDDHQLFLDEGLISEGASELIVSSGVDLDRFHFMPAADEASLCVVMPSRLLWEKGVGEFVEAAKRCRRKWPQVRFLLAGGLELDHPAGVPRSQVERWIAEGAIEHLGFVRDIEQLYHSSTLVVLPSYYREGVPRVLLEAAACGVPVITCDAPGCREAVVDQVTGLLVRPKDPQVLMEAIDRLLHDRELRQRMGEAARLHVERFFDQRAIVAKHLDLYRRIGIPLDSDDESSNRNLLAA